MKKINMFGLAGLLLCGGLPAAGAGISTTEENLIKNPGFEKTVIASEKDLEPYFMKGWTIGGNQLLPAPWTLDIPEKSHSRWVPGYFEVITDKNTAPEGRNYIKLANPEGVKFLRTSVSQEISVPAGHAIKWSFRLRGHRGESKFGGSKNQFGASRNVQYFVLFQYRTDEGIKNIQSRMKTATDKWAKKEGTVYLAGCTGKKCLVSFVAFQGVTAVPAVIYIDDICFQAIPEQETAPEHQKDVAVKNEKSEETDALPALISRNDYKIGKDWKTPGVCGKDFWFVFFGGYPKYLNRYPILEEIYNNAAFIIAGTTPPSTKENPDPPFFRWGPRWNEGVFCDLADSKYFRNSGKVQSFRPKKTLNGVKGHNFDGWKSSGKPPQSILYDFYDKTYVDSVRVYPAFGDNRKTDYALEISDDGKIFTEVAEKKGLTTREGDSFPIERETVFLRITVLKDSKNQACILETEILDKAGKPVKPLVISATSEAEPVNSAEVSTIVERIDAYKKKYGEKFLGFILPEWQNCFKKSLLDGGRKSIHNPELFKSRHGNFPFRLLTPESGQESYDAIRFGFEKIMKAYGGDTENGAEVSAFGCTASMFEHYACELGSKICVTELANITYLHARTHYMFARAAARQYQKPWFMYLTHNLLSGKAVENFKKKAGIANGTQPGNMLASESLFFRYFMTVFMMGMNFYEQENPFWTGDAHGISGSLKKYPGLSPMGRELIRAYKFTRKIKDRGVSYTPIAFCVDFLHGLTWIGPWTHQGEKDRSYTAFWATVNTILPYKEKAWNNKPPHGINIEVDNLRLANSQFGDVFDVLVPNPPKGVLPRDKFDSYKVIVLLGNINFTPELGKRFNDFVKNGGTLVANVIHLGNDLTADFAGIHLLKETPAASQKAFDKNGKMITALRTDDRQKVTALKLADKTEVLVKDENDSPLFVAHPQGKGMVITCCVPEMISDKDRLMPGAEYMLKHLHDEALPFKVEGDIEFLINRAQDNTWLITLINNRGIYKEPFGPLVREDDKTAVVKIIPKRNVVVTEANELMEGNFPLILKENNRIVSVTECVPPGDVRVVELK